MKLTDVNISTKRLFRPWKCRKMCSSNADKSSNCFNKLNRFLTETNIDTYLFKILLGLLVLVTFIGMGMIRIFLNFIQNAIFILNDSVQFFFRRYHPGIQLFLFLADCMLNYKDHNSMIKILPFRDEDLSNMKFTGSLT